MQLTFKGITSLRHPVFEGVHQWFAEALTAFLQPASRDDALDDRRPSHTYAVPLCLLTSLLRWVLVTSAVLLASAGVWLSAGLLPRVLTRASPTRTPATAGSSSSIRNAPRLPRVYLRNSPVKLCGHAISFLRCCLLRALDAMDGMTSWFRSFSLSGDARASSVKAAAQDFLKARQKLEGYHQLAQEAIERAYKADIDGRHDAAARLYTTALEASREGLELNTGPSLGLGPLADSVSGWRADLEAWRDQVAARLQAIKSGAAASSRSAPPVRPVPHASIVKQGMRQQPKTASAPAGPSGRPSSAGRSRPTSAFASAGAATPVSRSVVIQRPASGAAARPAPPAPASAPSRPSAAGAPAAVRGGAASRGGNGGSGSGGDDGLAKYREIVSGEILDRSPGVKWDDVAGLGTAKAALTEAVILPALRPDLFQGLRAPVRGILLYGPPGNGKTMLAKALAAESRATFFNISASSLTSKWVGDGEKLVRALFDVAAQRQPAIIFMDELDSMMGSRGKAGESDAARRLLTEFLVQFDGVGGAGRERVVVVGATNRPQELDDAVRRRLSKRIYIPLPDAEGRRAVLTHLLKGQPHSLRSTDFDAIVHATAGYSASDLAALCKEAAMAPLREVVPALLAVVSAHALRRIAGRDFAAALDVVRPSVDAASLRAFEEFTRAYGTQ